MSQVDPWTPSQARSLEITARISSAFSIAGCLFVLVTFISSSKFRKPVNRIIFYAIWANILCNIGTAISLDGINRGVNSTTCQLQGFLVQWGSIADVLWNLSLAMNVYLTVFKRYSQEQLRGREIYYLLVNFGATFIVALVLLFISSPSKGKAYGSSDYWCWISNEWSVLRICLIYVPVWIALVVIILLYTTAGYNVWQKNRELAQFDTLSTSKSHTDPRQFELDESPARPWRHTQVTVSVQHDSWANEAGGAPRPSQTHDRPAAAVVAPASQRNSGNPSPPPYEPYSVSVRSGNDPRSPLTYSSDPRAEKAERKRAAAARRKAHSAASAYTKRATFFSVALIVTWSATSINAVYTLAQPAAFSWSLSHSASLFVPLMGFWNTVTYVVCSWDAVKGIGADLRAWAARRGLFGRAERDVLTSGC